MATPITRDELDKQLEWFTDTVSKGVRTISFGTIAGVWAVLSADRLTLAPNVFWTPTGWIVTGAFVLASLTLLLDILQYVAAYRMTDIGIDRWEQREQAGEKVQFKYDKENLGAWGLFLYRANFRLLKWKLITAVATGVVFAWFAFSIQLA